MPDEPNVFEITSWERELGRARGSQLGPEADSAALNCSLYEVDPGAQAVRYHAHHANEELAIEADSST